MIINYLGYGGRGVRLRWEDLPRRVADLIVDYISRCIYVKIDSDYMICVCIYIVFMAIDSIYIYITLDI